MAGQVVGSIIYTGHDSSFARARQVADAVLAAGRHGVRLDVVAISTKRSKDQNARLHWLCGLIAKAKPWGGRKRKTEDWKRILVDAWSRETHRMAAEFVPSLDGSGVVSLGAQTRRMSVAEMDELIEFAQAWMTDEGIDIPVRPDDELPH